MSAETSSERDTKPDEWWKKYVRPDAAEYIARLAREQGVKPIESIDELVIPELAGEDADEILRELRALRDADR